MLLTHVVRPDRHAAHPAERRAPAHLARTQGPGLRRAGRWRLLAARTSAAALETLAAEVRVHGGTASVMTLSSRDESQRAEILAQFDRGEAYMQWRETVTALQSELDKLTETEARRRLRGVADGPSLGVRSQYCSLKASMLMTQ